MDRPDLPNRLGPSIDGPGSLPLFLRGVPVVSRGPMSSTLTPTSVPTLRTLADALDTIDGADPSSRVQAAIDAISGLGFDHVMIALRDETLTATLVRHTHRAGVPPAFQQAMPGVVWRRRLAAIERYRVGDLFLLDGSDPWVAREFFGSEPSPRAADPMRWLPHDLIVALLRDDTDAVIGTVKIAGPRDGRRPADAALRELGLVLRHLGERLAIDALRALADRRAQRLQRLQEAGAALARSLDEQEIIRELARQALRVSAADGVIVASPDLESDVLTTSLRLVRGVERPRAPVRLGDGIMAEVARTGRPVRIGDREADRARERSRTAALSLYDVLGDAEPAVSVLAVPMRAGTRLVGVLAVHASTLDVFNGEDEEVLATMASQAATAIANARRYAESERERRQTEALADVARAVGGSLRLGEVHRLILRHALSLLHAEGACIALRIDDYLHIVAAAGAADVLAGVHLPVAGSLLGRAVRTGQEVVSNDFIDDPHSSRTVQRLATIHRAAIAPMRTADGTIGAIAVINRAEPFREEDARVLRRLADQVAVAIVNARLFEAVEKATREWKAAFDATASGIVVLDEEQRVRRCNARAAELCGRDGVQALLGAAFRDALGGPDAPAALDDLLLSFRGSEGVTRGTVPVDATGRLFELIAAPHPDGGWVVSFDDVTAQRADAEALARSEMRYSRLVESASDAIFTLDLEGRFTSVNRSFETESGRTRETLLGTSYAELVDGQDQEAAADALRRVVSGERVTMRLRYLAAGGEVRIGALTATPLSDDDGRVTGMLCIMHDVTDEQRRQAMAAQAERAAAVGQYLSRIANELNNPLGSLLAVAEVEAESESLPADARRILAGIREDAQRASRIVTHLLAITREPMRESSLVALDELVAGPVAAPPADERPPASGSILLVEDEPALADAVGRYLGRHGYQVTVANGGREAMDRLHGATYDLILLDLRMDDLSGDAVYARLAQERPELARRVVLVTGDLHAEWATEFAASTGRPVLAKPFELAQLLQLVQSIIGARPA